MYYNDFLKDYETLSDDSEIPWFGDGGGGGLV